MAFWSSLCNRCRIYGMYSVHSMYCVYGTRCMWRLHCTHFMCRMLLMYCMQCVVCTNILHVRCFVKAGFASKYYWYWCRNVSCIWRVANDYQDKINTDALRLILQACMYLYIYIYILVYVLFCFCFVRFLLTYTLYMYVIIWSYIIHMIH